MQTTYLRVVTEAGAATVPAGEPFIIGRARTADYVIADSRVSRRHLLVEQTGAGWSVRDISSNGTWVDGQRMPESVSVQGEVRFRLGTPSGPEVVVMPEFPAARGGYGESDYDPGAYEMETMLPGSSNYQPPRPTAPTRGQGGGRGQTAPVGQGVPAGRGSGPQQGYDPAQTPSGSTSLDQEHERRTTYRLRPGTMTMGRARDNDIVITDLLASRRHAELYIGRSGLQIADLESANGVFVNGRRINRANVNQGDVIAVGHHVFQLEGDLLVEYLDSGDVSFEVDALNVWAGEKQLMHDMTFKLPGRALLGVVGPSGAGKSTLLNALTGFRPADKGNVRYAGRDMYSEYDELRRRIGYVPQEDLLHTSLTVRKALEFGAELRFPPDTTKAERRQRVDEVLAELGLTHHANTQVSRLSGGQRKRTSVALELLTKPTLLYLDEPTSGLDPGMDKNVMESLRKLADDGRTVIVVTHSVAQLDLCDYVLVLAPGGYVAYFGPPADALPFFQARDYPDVFLTLEATPGAESAARFRQSRYYVPASVTAPSARPAPEDLPSIRQQSVVSQLVTLSRRMMAVVASDKSYLRLIIAFPFLLGAIPRAIPGDLEVVADGPNRDAPTVLLVLTLCACFMGMSNSVREIVKERPIYRRERAIGLSRTAYIGSKIVVLILITTLQAAVFTTIGLAGRKMGDGLFGFPFFEAMVAVIALSLASAMLGLVISALVDNADKTMPLLVLITMAQLVFSGGLVPAEGTAGLEQASWIAPARWGFAGLSSVIDLNKISGFGSPLNPDFPADPLYRFTTTQFAIDMGGALAVGVVCVVITSLLVRRMDPKTNKRRPAATPTR
ncbi:ATP-binding cassette domain-containing protein [Parafrankia sp. EUN1f]|uniref:ATP-binding cassette domain-containing protein n=1 Tax=Parafrankia sp. EUN1f TaxID=102897 RepID=UPI0001C43ED7|nr:ATP-binding cassette domain-containing protein [Parafrankia sp. EUN1f]EFC84258.1 FHA modulated ABC efflux pump with fused ATPase and integral membrane subunits [Parafrankia sp. EUN1f]